MRKTFREKDKMMVKNINFSCFLTIFSNVFFAKVFNPLPHNPMFKHLRELDCFWKYYEKEENASHKHIATIFSTLLTPESHVFSRLQIHLTHFLTTKF